MDLIKKLLTFNSEKRITAMQALDHAWIKQVGKEEVDTNATANALKNLKNFRVLINNLLIFHYRLNKSFNKQLLPLLFVNSQPRRNKKSCTKHSKLLIRILMVKSLRKN